MGSGVGRAACPARARGWERQLDIGFNPIFYSKPLTARSYRQWLSDNGVAYVALPDVQLDDSSLKERSLLLRGVPYLHEVWHDAHWRVWRVAGFTGLIKGHATLREIEPDRVTLAVQAPGDLVLRIHATRHWALHGGGCVRVDRRRLDDPPRRARRDRDLEPVAHGHALPELTGPRQSVRSIQTMSRVGMPFSERHAG